MPNKTSVIPQYLAGINPHYEIEYSEVCMKDSRQLNVEDLKAILQAVENSTAQKIIVVHGTYTMPDTARYLTGNLKRRDQVIILTGSMMPLEGFAKSDAPFNLGFAFAKADHMKPGVYIAMNGQILKSNEALKIISEGRFTSLFNS